MSKRERNRNSIAASAEGIRRVQNIIRTKRNQQEKPWSRDDLAEEAELSVATVNRFFSRDKIDVSNFQQIVSVLGLSVEDVAEEVPSLPTSYEYYIRRSEEKEEERCYVALLKPGAVVRVKAPQLMGKTLFINEVLTRIERRLPFRKVELEINRQVLSSTEEFFKWLCASISNELDLPTKPNSCWREELTPSQNITSYFQKHLLTQIIDMESSLMLVLDHVDYIFENLAIMDEFSALLRSWSEKIVKSSPESREIWKHLRLVTVYSTDIYGLSDNINYSPFDSIGTDIKLLEFSREQIEELAKRYRLDWEERHTSDLVKLVGGHPYLIDTAFSYLKHQREETDKVLQRITETACTQIGIYANHLLQIANALEGTELKDQFKKIVTLSEPMPIPAVDAFKLYSMGLIKLIDASDNIAVPRCHLYQRYFHNHFKRQEAI